jgi:Domain of unknown function (DUF4399)
MSAIGKIVSLRQGHLSIVKVVSLSSWPGMSRPSTPRRRSADGRDTPGHDGEATDLPPLDEPVPSDQKHPHFGLGEEAVIELPPGPHTLQLLMGDANHVPHNPPLASRKITITIEPGP